MTTTPRTSISLVLLAATLASSSSCSSSGSTRAGGPQALHDQLRRSELGLFMKSQMNPPFSKLSFLLFHAEAEDESEPNMLPATARELSRAAASLATWADPPGESAQGQMVFFDYAESLKGDIANLEIALRANQRDSAVKAFESLRKKCDSCHHFFRYASGSR